jgi:hypothetical protein
MCLQTETGMVAILLTQATLDILEEPARLAPEQNGD